MYFGLIKNVIQLELVPIVLELHEMIEGRIDSSSFVRLNDKEIADPEDIDTKSFMTFIDRVKQIDLKCREDTKLLYQQEGKMDELPASGIPIALEEYLTEQNEKAKAYILSQELKYQEQVDFFGELLAEAVPTAIEDFILRSQKYLEQIHDTRSIEIEKEYKKWIDLKEKHLLALRPDLCSPNNAECLKELCFKEALRTQTAQTNLKQFRAELLCEDIKNSILFEKQLVSVFRCLMLILDSSLMTLEDLKSFSGQEMPKSKRKSLKRLRKIARIQENGDAREVKRSEDELKKLKQSGESPRFPKRSWPAIESFGIHTFWVQEKQRLLAQDPSDALLADMVPLVAPNTDSGACVSLLTHAHRCALHARDEGYSTYVAFLKTLCTNMTQKIHERLKDEKKWTQSWMITIDKMQKPPSSIS
jgi:hypothetical protein